MSSCLRIWWDSALSLCLHVNSMGGGGDLLTLALEVHFPAEFSSNQEIAQIVWTS